MIKLENVEVLGWKAAIRGMRNPMNSWDKSDTIFCGEFSPKIGENDLKLMKSLSKAGSDHGKFLRYIVVSFDVEAPLYWWKEMETYRVGVAENPSDIEFNSCSTMHKIHAKEFTLDDFSHEHMTNGTLDVLDCIIDQLNFCRKWYLVDNHKDWWWQMIQLLPTSYNQKRTIQLNYQVLKNIYFARKNHKLDEWHVFCDWIRDLPYAKQIITLEE